MPEKLEMSEIINNQRKVKVYLKNFEVFVTEAIRKTTEAGGKSVTVVFVSDRKMRFLNKTFRGKNMTTDVLSFPFEAEEFEKSEINLGDIFISLEQAAKQASENNLAFNIEIKQLILHGILHLCGFDHETDHGEMNLRELELRKALNI